MEKKQNKIYIYLGTFFFLMGLYGIFTAFRLTIFNGAANISIVLGYFLVPLIFFIIYHLIYKKIGKKSFFTSIIRHFNKLENDSQVKLLEFFVGAILIIIIILSIA